MDWGRVLLLGGGGGGPGVHGGRAGARPGGPGGQQEWIGPGSFSWRGGSLALLNRLSGGGRYGVVSTASSWKDATAPLASSGAFGLVLHLPFFGPDLYLGPYPAKWTWTAPGPESPANLPVLLLPTTDRAMSSVSEKWQAFRFTVWLMVGLAVINTVRIPAELVSDLVLPFFAPEPLRWTTPVAFTRPRSFSGMLLPVTAALPWTTP